MSRRGNVATVHAFGKLSKQGFVCTRHGWQASTNPASLDEASTVTSHHPTTPGDCEHPGRDPAAALPRSLGSGMRTRSSVAVFTAVAVDENHEIEVRDGFRCTPKITTNA